MANIVAQAGMLRAALGARPLANPITPPSPRSKVPHTQCILREEKLSNGEATLILRHGEEALVAFQYRQLSQRRNDKDSIVNYSTLE